MKLLSTLLFALAVFILGCNSENQAPTEDTPEIVTTRSEFEVGLDGPLTISYPQTSKKFNVLMSGGKAPYFLDLISGTGSITGNIRDGYVLEVTGPEPITLKATDSNLHHSYFVSRVEIVGAPELTAPLSKPILSGIAHKISPASGYPPFNIAKIKGPGTILDGNLFITGFGEKGELFVRIKDWLNRELDVSLSVELPFDIGFIEGGKKTLISDTSKLPVPIVYSHPYVTGMNLGANRPVFNFPSFESTAAKALYQVNNFGLAEPFSVLMEDEAIVAELIGGDGQMVRTSPKTWKVVTRSPSQITFEIDSRRYGLYLLSIAFLKKPFDVDVSFGERGILPFFEETVTRKDAIVDTDGNILAAGYHKKRQLLELKTIHTRPVAQEALVVARFPFEDEKFKVLGTIAKDRVGLLYGKPINAFKSEAVRLFVRVLSRVDGRDYTPSFDDDTSITATLGKYWSLNHREAIYIATTNKDGIHIHKFKGLKPDFSFGNDGTEFVPIDGAEGIDSVKMTIGMVSSVENETKEALYVYAIKSYQQDKGSEFLLSRVFSRLDTNFGVNGVRKLYVPLNMDLNRSFSPAFDGRGSELYYGGNIAGNFFFGTLDGKGAFKNTFPPKSSYQFLKNLGLDATAQSQLDVRGASVTRHGLWTLLGRSRSELVAFNVSRPENYNSYVLVGKSSEYVTDEQENMNAYSRNLLPSTDSLTLLDPVVTQDGGYTVTGFSKEAAFRLIYTNSNQLP